VDWFNKVDATYRGDLREINEVNFGRFDAKLEQRLAELDAQWGERWTALDAKVEQRIADVRAEIRVGLATLKGELTAVGIVGTALGVVALLLRR
jgi:hypothetical protein